MANEDNSGIRIVEEYAAKSVAGSTFRVIVDGVTHLHECGHRYSKSKDDSFPFNPKDVRVVTFGHAHMDHIGRFLELARQGYNGGVYATQITAALAKLQFEQDAASVFLNNKMKKGPFRNFPTRDDVKEAMNMFVSYGDKLGIPLRQEVEISPGVSIKFYEAGHIPGSALTMYKINKEGLKRNLLLAYDLGRTDFKIAGHPICDTPFVRFPETDFDEEVDFAVVEATYGGREHKPISDSIGSLEEAIKRVEKTKGILFVPAFTIMRTQMAREFIFRLDQEGKLSKEIMVCTSTPGADSVDRIMMANYMDLDEQAIQELKTPKNSSFCWDKYIRHKKLDETLTFMKERIGNVPTIVIASSGMCDMGRAVPLSKAVIGDKRNVVLKMGYASPESRMDKMLIASQPNCQEKDREISYDGEKIRMEAGLVEIGGTSGHADWREIEAFLRNLRNPEKGQRFKAIFIKHGEEKACYALAEKLKEARNAGENIIVMEPHVVYGHKREK
jgi:metallo-beta-lactamase family protein